MEEINDDLNNELDAQQRLLSLIKHSSSDKLMDKADLARTYKVSIKTVERDLKKLSEFGFKIERLGESDKSKFRLKATSDNPMIAHAIKQFAQKSDISDLFPMLESRFLKELIEGRYDDVINVNTGRFTYNDYETQLFPRLIRAVSSKLTVSFSYKGKMRTDVHPYRLLNRGGVWYLLAFDGKLKMFTISNLSTFRVFDDIAFTPDKKLLAEVSNISAHESSVWFGDKEIKFRLKVDKEVSSYFKGRKFFPQQRLAGASSDGSIFIESIVHHEKAIIPIILSWMPHITIEEPKEYQDKINAMLSSYLNR